MSGRLLSALVVALAAAWAPASLAAQIEDCEFLPGTRNWTSRTSGSSSVTYVSRPRIRCNDGRYIEADSAVSFSASGYTELIGRVYFQDATQSLRAQQARYYDAMRRLEADVQVVLTDRRSGNVMRGERLLYLREMPGRPREELTMSGGRPTAMLYPEDDPEAGAPGAGGETRSPYEVEADRLYLLGEALFRAYGRVEVVRDSLEAQADSMDYDREAGVIDFNQDARLREGDMDLRGQHIRLLLPGQVIQEIVATGEATLLGEDLDLDAHVIHLYFTDEALDRLVAVGEARALREAGADEIARPAGPTRAPVVRDAPEPAGADSLAADATAGRAVARSADLVMSADSLEVLAPGETLERVTAVGGARAVSTARDSLNTPDTPELVRSDWIEGDTVVAILRPEGPPPGRVADPATRIVADADPDPALRPGAPGAASEQAGGGDGSRDYVLERLTASVNARSLYRMDPDSGAAVDTPAGAEPEAAADTLAVTSDSLRLVSAHRTLAVHYVEADRILIAFVDGAVDLMEVTGLRRGLYMEPSRAPRVSTVPGGRP